MTSYTKMSPMSRMSSSRMSSSTMSTSSDMFVLGSWDESEFEDSVRNLSLSNFSDSDSDFSDIEDFNVLSTSTPARSSMSASFSRSRPISVPSFKSPSISESFNSTDVGRYNSFRDMKRDLSDRQIHEEFRSMSKQTYSQDLFGSSPPTSIKSPLMFHSSNNHQAGITRNTSFPESLCSVGSTTTGDSGFDSDNSSLDEPIQFLKKSESAFIPSSDRFLVETDVGKSKEYETLGEMKSKLSDAEIHQEFVKLSRQSWHHDSGIFP